MIKKNISNGMENKKTLRKLRNYINQYDSIFVIKENNCIGITFSKLLPRQVERKILFLVKEPITTDIPDCSIDILLISDEEYYEIENMYYLYEFSDRIHIISRNSQYGSLDNYISNGLLTEEEAFLALLG